LKNHARVNLKIEEPEGGRRAPRAEEKPSRDDDEDDLKF